MGLRTRTRSSNWGRTIESHRLSINEDIWGRKRDDSEREDGGENNEEKSGKQ